MKGIWLGVLAAVFFAVTFVLNRSMELSGGSWMWSASLRYFFMVPFLAGIVAMRGGFSPIKREIRRHPWQFFLWSTVAFVLFYGPLTFSAGYAPGWLLAGTWQLTIAAGVLMTPLFLSENGATGTDGGVRERIPVPSLLISLVILGGVVLIQIPHAQSVPADALLLGTLPVVVAAFAYPLGNRKMMELLGGSLDTFQRVLGMTLMTLPIWFLLALYAWMTVGLPSWSQLVQSFIVGVSSGVIATTLFFMATDLVRHDQGRLAAVEATQSLELLFAMLGEMLLLHMALPGPVSLAGTAIIILGMSLHSWQTAAAAKRTAAGSL